MSITNLIRSELQKLTTTRMPLAFGTVLLVLAATNGVAVAAGTDMDGSKGFIATGADQQSLIAFAANALMLAALFGAVATAREYAHNTAIATYLVTPRRGRALGAQYTAVAIGGAVLGIAGVVSTAAAVALALPLTDHGFLVGLDGLVRVLAASAGAGAAGAVLGAGIGNVIRNTGGAVTGAVVALLIAPPVVVQLASAAAPWVPTNLAHVVSGVANDTATGSAIVAIGLWALVPALVGHWSVTRRDVA